MKNKEIESSFDSDEKSNGEFVEDLEEEMKPEEFM